MRARAGKTKGLIDARHFPLIKPGAGPTPTGHLTTRVGGDSELSRACRQHRVAKPTLDLLILPINFLARIIKRTTRQRATFTGMKGEGASPMNGHQTCHQNIKCLYAKAGNLREIVLRRLAAVGCKIKEKSLAKAETIVNGRIAELIVNPEYAILLDRRGGESQLLSLLVQACAAELHSAIPPVVGHSSLSQQAQETDTAKQRICRPAADN